LRQQWVVIYLGYAYTQMPLVTFTREVLQLAPPARDKALKKIRNRSRGIEAEVPM